jgi:hypothetical protein
MNPIYLTALKGSMKSGEWGLLVTTGKISPATRQEGLRDPEKIVSTIAGSDLVNLCTKYSVGIKQHFTFDKSLLDKEEAEEQPEPPPLKIVPKDLTSVLTEAIKENFQRIGNSPYYRSKTKNVIARWSQKYDYKNINYWYGLKASDVESVNNQKITDFAYVCSNQGVILLPSSIVMKKIDEGALVRSPKNGPLIHYHIKFNETNEGMQWILKNGVPENVNQFFHRISAREKIGLLKKA